MSTNRGVAPALTMADTVGMAVFEVVITSSPGLHVEGAERQHQGVGAAVDADAVACAAVGRQLLLEGADAVAENQAAGAQDLIDGRQDIVALGLVFCAIIPDWYGHGDAEYPNRSDPIDVNPLRKPSCASSPRLRRARSSSGRAASGSFCRPFVSTTPQPLIDTSSRFSAAAPCFSICFQRGDSTDASRGWPIRMPDLIGCYRAVRDEPEAVIAALAALEREHRARGSDCYYEVRDERFNPARLQRTRPVGPLRSGPGGDVHLSQSHRVQRAVPAESKRRVQRARGTIRGSEDLRSRSRARGRARPGTPGVTLECMSFDKALSDARAGDFIYCDPPYAPVSKTAHFAHYTAGGFSEADHRRLLAALVAGVRRGATVLLSNSSAPVMVKAYTASPVRDAGLVMHRVPARRAINSRAALRGPVDELIVTNAPGSAVRQVPDQDAARGGYAPAIHTSFRQLGQANARRRSETKVTYPPAPSWVQAGQTPRSLNSTEATRSGRPV